jgi:hypothetical protein
MDGANEQSRKPSRFITFAPTEAELRALGASVLPVVTDVSQVRDVELLAHKTLDAYGAIHLLCNNAIRMWQLREQGQAPCACPSRITSA